MKKGNQDIDLYEWDKQAKIHRQKLKDHPKILAENKRAILDFIEHKSSEVMNGKAISKAREVKYLYRLRLIAEELNKPFKDLKEKEVLVLLDRLYKKQVIRGERQVIPSQATKNDIAVILKTFLCWLWKTDKIKYIQPPQIEVKGLRDEDRLTWDDILHLSKAANNERDPALVQTLFESGMRIEELLTLKRRDVSVIENGRAVRLNMTQSKTKIRPVIIVRSTPALISWMEKHPLKDNDSPLWVNTERNTRNLSYNGVNALLKDLAKRSGLTKPVNPHNYRKSSASFYQGILSDQELKARFGWTQDSRMLKVYVNPDQRTIEDKLLKAEGIRKSDDSPQEIQPKTCFFCGKVNPIGREYCANPLCKKPLDMTSEMKELESWYEFNRNFSEYKKRFPSEANNAVEAMVLLMRKIEGLERKINAPN